MGIFGFVHIMAMFVIAVLAKPDLQDSSLPLCRPAKVSCKGSNRFRSMDGSCNNKEHPAYGAANSNLLRLRPSEYGDGKGSERLSKTGAPLPNSRNISNIFSEKVERKSPTISHLHVMWGQLVAHDITLTALVKNPDSTKLDCNCSNPHPECANIPIQDDEDEQCIKADKHCIHFSKSLEAAGKNCRYERKEQVNSVTAFLDGSIFYGVGAEATNALRDKKANSGELLVEKANGKNAHGILDFCESNTTCFISTDERAKENPAITTLHVIWTKYHNIIAGQLRKLNSNWSGNKIYKTTRNVIVSLFQMITYKDYLPLVLGPEWMAYFDLEVTKEGLWQGYNPQYNSGITNAFTTAAFRFGHVQVSAFFSMEDPHFKKSFTGIETGSIFKFTKNVTKGTFASVIRGLMVDDALQTNPAMVDGLRNHLFRKNGYMYGEDLFAINTQRGRENGLPGYNEYRELCTLKKVETFVQLSGEISLEKIHLLENVYQSVDDIDLFVGGLAENHVKGGIIGPTFACIIAYQFRALRKGDRFWYESGFALTLSQLEALRKVSLSRILCETSDDMEYTMSNPMLLPTDVNNSIVRCDSLPPLDLRPWFNDGKGQRLKNTPMVTQWSVWFPTKASNPWLLDTSSIVERIRNHRKAEICADILDHETRSVPGNDHLQLRFKCGAGTIPATNFPAQLSDRYRWTDWVSGKPLQYADGVTVTKEYFDCRNPVALQIYSAEGGFSIQLADVFEEFSVDRGVICRHKNQVKGLCQELRARMLCGVREYVPLPKSLLPDGAEQGLFLEAFFKRLCSVTNFCIQTRKSLANGV